MCFVNVNSRDYHFKSLWLAWIVFDSQDLWMPVFFCKKYISSTIQGGILLISSSRVVGPAGHWYLLMRFVSSTRTLYTRPFLKSTKTCFAPLKMDSFGKTILGFLFWGQKDQTTTFSRFSRFSRGILARFGKGTMVGGYGPSHTHLSLQSL